MNTTQRQFINILSSAIFDKEVDFDSNEKIKWESIIDEAKAHNVTGLIYSVISRSKYLDIIDEKSIDQLKRETFITGASQVQHMMQISKVLDKLNHEDIPVIALKGLVIRALYPNPELRSMCDADILVKEEDIDKLTTILIDFGYIVDSSDAKHIVFKHKNHFSIEVHWTLTNRDYYKGRPIFEHLIWQNSIKVNVGKSEALSLAYEDLAVHLCIHMAAHSTSSGFGIRHLCDLVLLVKEKGNLINWKGFLYKIEVCGIEKFTIAIFFICNKLFGMTNPFEFNNSSFLNEVKLFLLIDDIFEAGVHGKRSLSKMYGNHLAYYSHNNDGLSITKRFIKELFPPINKLSNQFTYVKKYTILAPIAWVSYFLHGMFSKKYNLLNKINFCILTVHNSNKRKKLLRWLELI